MELPSATSLLQLTCNQGGNQITLPPSYNPPAPTPPPPTNAGPGAARRSHCSQTDLAGRLTSSVTRSHSGCDWLLVAGPESDTELFINSRILIAAPRASYKYCNPIGLCVSILNYWLVLPAHSSAARWVTEAACTCTRGGVGGGGGGGGGVEAPGPCRAYTRLHSSAPIRPQYDHYTHARVHTHTLNDFK